MAYNTVNKLYLQQHVSKNNITNILTRLMLYLHRYLYRRDFKSLSVRRQDSTETCRFYVIESKYNSKQHHRIYKDRTRAVKYKWTMD